MLLLPLLLKSVNTNLSRVVLARAVVVDGTLSRRLSTSFSCDCSSRRPDNSASDAAAACPDSASAPVLSEQRGAVTVITLNRPDRRNCVDPAMARHLAAALRNFERCRSARVAVLYGAGGTFCSGFDLHWLHQHGNSSSSSGTDPSRFWELDTDEAAPPAAPAAAEADDDDLEEFGPMGPTGRPCAKPVVAAVEGYAVAGGLELALMADLRVVDETARLGVLSRRLGVPMLDAGTARLVAAVGLTRALDLALTGRLVGGAEAERYGLASCVVPCGAALGQAMRLAEEMSRVPPRCLLVDRAAIYRAAHAALPLREAMRQEWQHGREPLYSEGVEGAGKFVAGAGRHGKLGMEPRWQPPWQRRQQQQHSPEEPSRTHSNSS